MFGLSRLAPPLSAPPTRMCRTPEAFLGPTGASLVNLDALIPSNPPSKTHKNPFLSGTAWSFTCSKKHICVFIQDFFSSQVWALHLPPTLSTATTRASPSTKCGHPPRPRCPPTCSPTAPRCPSLYPTSRLSSPPPSRSLPPDSWTFPPTSRSPCSPSPRGQYPVLSHRHITTTPSSEMPWHPAPGCRAGGLTFWIHHTASFETWPDVVVHTRWTLDWTCRVSHQLLYLTWTLEKRKTHIHTHTHFLMTRLHLIRLLDAFLSSTASCDHGQSRSLQRPGWSHSKTH